MLKIDEEFDEEFEQKQKQEQRAQDEANNQPASTATIKMRIDPGVLLAQLQELRKEGVDESTIRAALNEAMEAAQGEPRKALNSMKAHRDAPSMPSQEDMNLIYVRRYGNGIDDSEIQNETVSDIVKAVVESRKRNSFKPTLRVRIATYFVIKALKGLIYICKALGVK
jgi:hypothetical protein